MSQNLNFCVKLDGKFYRMFGEYSRNSAVADIFKKAIRIPYAKLTSITKSNFDILFNDVKHEISKITEEFQNIETVVKDIYSSNNPLDEKLEIVSDYRTEIREMQNYLDELVYVQDLLKTMQLSIEDYEYKFFWDTTLFDTESIIYVGWEVTDDYIKSLNEGD